MVILRGGHDFFLSGFKWGGGIENIYLDVKEGIRGSIKKLP